MKSNNQIVKAKEEKGDSFKKQIVLIYNIILIIMWVSFSFQFFMEVFQNKLDRAAWIPNTYLQKSIKLLKYVQIAQWVNVLLVILKFSKTNLASELG